MLPASSKSDQRQHLPCQALTSVDKVFGKPGVMGEPIRLQDVARPETLCGKCAQRPTGPRLPLGRHDTFHQARRSKGFALNDQISSSSNLTPFTSGVNFSLRAT